MADMNREIMDHELEARYEKYKGILKNLTIMSDVFMRNVFKRHECTEYVLQVIMGKKDLKVLDQVLQKDYKNLQGRSAILDCVVRDADGRQFDVEIQQDTEGASPKRVYEVKETQEGVDSMCREMNEIYNEGEKRGWDKGIAQGIEFGEMKKAKETALTLAEKGMSVADIADIVKVSVKLVEEWLSGSMSLVK